MEEELVDAVFAVVALLFVLLVVLGAYATVKVVGAAKRRVDDGIAQARRTVEDHTLRAKSFAQPGPAGELAQLRLKLRTSMRATQDALHAGVAEDESLKESLGLFDRLSAHGHELDAELRRLESEPDRATLAERLPELRERTERIVRSADSLRWAVRDRARRFAEDELDTLNAQIDVETGALRHWQTTDSSSTPPPWPEAPAAEAGVTSEQTWSDTPRSQRAEEPTRPAITPPGPRPTYPWQKKTRPENTT
ncbi:putative Secreted protein [Streptomyces viridochromogenes Tue57]|uniref:Putative Secreted protein n=1 Tax=Streptomyces viridochromogenes Tue57 TaxID=1160705 RepID=L8P9V9_STRVR|nr:putative Secreted protein [Streptomyces viridochromogenes Tue57]